LRHDAFLLIPTEITSQKINVNFLEISTLKN